MKKLLMMVFIILGSTTLLANNYALAKGPHGHMHGKKHFDAMDTDKDGKISHDEHMAKCEKRFKMMDTNHDGFLTKEECSKAWSKHKKAMKHKMQEKCSQGQAGTAATEGSLEETKKKSN
jgi:hypothetical protein